MSLSDIPHANEEVSSYSALTTMRATVYAPENVAQLKELFAFARANKRRVTFRAGAHSYDEQSIGDDIVVRMTSVNDITVDEAGLRMTVGAGASWGAVYAKLQPRGLVPYSTVTTRYATCGGTLSADCLSRFSPVYGKEGTRVVSFDLLTLAGDILTCTRPTSPDPAAWTLGEEVFGAAVGAFGWLGAVVRITYEILFVGQTDGKIGVRSRVRKFRSYRELARYLVPTVRELEAIKAQVVPDDPRYAEALFSALFTDGNSEYALVLHSNYTKSLDRAPLAIHEPDSFATILAQLLLRSTWINRHTFWWAFTFLFKENKRYIDDLEGFAFFMDSNTNAKTFGQSLGFPMKQMQQTFVVPLASDRVGWKDADERLAKFLADAQAMIRAAGLLPTMHDVLYTPMDPQFFLSPSVDMNGFAVSYAFETSNPETLARAEALCRDLSDLCLAVHGRVSFVKNVFARKETLRAMYAKAIPRFVALKAKLDPDALLRNVFLERTLG